MHCKSVSRFIIMQCDVVTSLEAAADPPRFSLMYNASVHCCVMKLHLFKLLRLPKTLKQHLRWKQDG